jgi:hypothetical protein
VDARTLFIAFYASAELSCFLALGWPLPVRILDLYPEFRCRTSGLSTPCGSGLLGAMAWYGLDAIDAAEKDSMRELVLRGGPWTEKGIGVCCPVHDALLIEAPATEIEAAVEATQAVMRKASEIVLDGFPLRTEAKTVRHPQRYSVALAIWFEGGRRKSKEVRLTTAILQRFNVNRKAKYTALKALEKAGLVQVHRPRRNPLVTILDALDGSVPASRQS